MHEYNILVWSNFVEIIQYCIVEERLNCCLAVTEINKLCACERNYEVSHKIGDHVSLYTVTLEYFNFKEHGFS